MEITKLEEKKNFKATRFLKINFVKFEKKVSERWYLPVVPFEMHSVE